MISSLLTDAVVVPELAARDKDTALAMLAAQLATRSLALNESALVTALREREGQASTGLGDGLAIPHARLAGLDRMLGLFARSRRGIEWDAADKRPVHLILLLAGPADQPGAYMKVLASVSRVLRDADCRTRLMAAAGPVEILGVLRDGEARVTTKAGVL